MTTERIPEANSFQAEVPHVLWAAPDGTVFVSTITDGGRRSIVHRRDKTGLWEVIARRRSAEAAQLWGRTATDLYIMDGDSIAHYDGTKTVEITPFGPTLLGIGGIGEDVFVAGEEFSGTTGDLSPSSGQIRRRHGVAGSWASEPTIAGLRVNEVWTGGGTVWGRAKAPDDQDGSNDRLLQRGANGRWSEKKFYGAKRPSEVAVRSVWVSPTGEGFVATDESVFRSSNGATSWSNTGEVAGVGALWGRSNNDVYANTAGGLMHYDGKSWSPTSYARQTMGPVGGTSTVVLLAVTLDQE